MDHHHTFLFEVDEDTIIDAGRQGNEARFINHSCDPNCAAYVQDGRVFIEAVKNIQPGVELSYDYRLSREGLHRPEWTRLYPCRCGAANCRGTMLKSNRRPRSRRTARA
jgi:SET domain-containing protein